LQELFHDTRLVASRLATLIAQRAPTA